MKSIGNPFLKWLIPKLPTTVSNSEKIFKEIGHTYSIDNKLMDDFFMEWYVSLCNNTDTMKYDFDNAGHLSWLDHPEQHARLINEFMTDSYPDRKSKIASLTNAGSSTVDV